MHFKQISPYPVHAKFILFLHLITENLEREPMQLNQLIYELYKATLLSKIDQFTSHFILRAFITKIHQKTNYLQDDFTSRLKAQYLH